MLDKASESWAYYQRSLELFGGDEIIVVATEADTTKSEARLAAIESLSSHLSELEGVRRVDSISTQPIISVNETGDLDLSPAASNFEGSSAKSTDKILRRALSDRVLPRTLISEDSTVLAINVVLEQDAPLYYESVVPEVEKLAAGLSETWDDHWISGVPVFQRETSRQTRSELLAFGPITITIVFGLVSIIFRSFRAGFAVLTVGGLGNWIMFAAIGIVGTPVSFTMVILPPVVFALAAAYSMHMITAASARQIPKEAEHNDQLEDVATPIALSGLTTAIGFVATALTGISAIRNVGTFGGIGVLAVLALALTALPAILTIWPLAKRRPRGFDLISRRLAPIITGHTSRHPKLVVSLWTTLAVVAALGLGSVKIDTDATRWFRDGTSTRDDYESIRERLSGISPVNVIIEWSNEDKYKERLVVEPDTLEAIEKFDNYLELLPDVGKAVSIADPIRQIHEGFSSPSAGLPASTKAVQQYLLLLESVEQIADLVSTDRRAANVILRVDNNGSSEILETAALAEKWWQENGPPGTSARATGVMFEFARAQDAIARSQIVGLSSALLAIAFVLLATFRSGRAAAATLIPNMIPLIGIYGVMGFIGLPLDAGTVLVGSLALGIAVDDTVHLGNAYFTAGPRESEGQAVASAVRTVLPALSYTTVIVGVGFGVLALSSFSFIQNLGILMAVVMTVCLIADVHLLPTLLLGGRTRNSGSHKQNIA
ncbi:MAG: RND family transporter [Myxococcota bacterium]